MNERACIIDMILREESQSSCRTKILYQYLFVNHIYHID